MESNWIETAHATAEALLASARPWMEALVRDGAAEAPPAIPSHPAEVGGLFFTIYDKAGEMRGSGGTSQADRPLAELLAEAIRQAALDDPRFPPLEPADLPGCRLALTLLGTGKRIAGPADVVPGITTLFVRRGVLSGITTPEVAFGMGWDGPVFLNYACRKAGLHALSWKKPDTEVTAFPSVRAVEPW